MSIMKTKTALLAMGLFTLAGAVTISCGGSSDEDNGNGSTAGTAGTTAGTTSTAGTTGSGGKTSTGGTTNNTAGTTNNTAGTTNNNAGGAVDPGAGGATDPGAGGAFNPGAGGAGFAVPDCEAGVMDGDMCTRTQNGSNSCVMGDSTFCTCRGRNTQTWRCDTFGGAGGAGGGVVDCPANAMTGDDCTGQGLCSDQQCFCNGETTLCF
jgi:hypothetical protein